MEDYSRRLLVETLRALARIAIYGLAIAFIAFLVDCAASYMIARERIQADLHIASDAQATERLRIEATRSLPTGPASGTGSPNGPKPPTSSDARKALEDLVDKAPPAPGGNQGKGDAKSTLVIMGMVDALVSVGAVAANEAKGLKDALQKAGIEIGTDAAKALIDRYIRVHDKPASSGPEKTSSQATNVNMYCGAQPLRIYPPKPPPPTASAPKKSCR